MCESRDSRALSAPGPSDADDVNEFLRRIRELGFQRDREDEERNRQLEEDIIEGRRRRQERQAERARSLSPIKDFSPSLSSDRRSESRSSARSLTVSPQPHQKHERPKSAYEALSAGHGLNIGLPSPTASDCPAITKSETAKMVNLTADSLRPSRSSSPSARSKILATSRAHNPYSGYQSIRSSPLASPGRFPVQEKQDSKGDEGIDDEIKEPSREQIQEALEQKPPSWFGQMGNRALSPKSRSGSAVSTASHASNNMPEQRRVQLPGMPFRTTQDGQPWSHNSARRGHSPSLLMSDLTSYASPNSTMAGSSRTSAREGGDLAKTRHSRVPEPCMDEIDREEKRSTEFSSERQQQSPAILPYQQKSVDRSSRSPSPTKGFGGFVQSAMMRRSDSMNKRWSTQSPPPLTRGDSISGLSMRSSGSLSSLQQTAGPAPISHRKSMPFDSAKTNLASTIKHDDSSMLRATTTRLDTSVGSSSPLLNSLTPPSSAIAGTSNSDDSIIKKRETTNYHQEANAREQLKGYKDLTLDTSYTSPPATPTRRWSPQKASWLENAINKPESPRPSSRQQQLTKQEPTWQADLNQRRGHDASTDSVALESVNHVGLKSDESTHRDGNTSPRFETSLFPQSTASNSLKSAHSAQNDEFRAKVHPKIAAIKPMAHSSSDPILPQKEERTLSTTVAPKSTSSGQTDDHSYALDKSRREQQIGQDKTVSSSIQAKSETAEPEFKKVFGNLKRTKTENYKAPDELKENILRGKAGLNMTGGPRKTVIRDEFKESILAKKKSMSALSATSIVKSTSGTSSETPEAIRFQQRLKSTASQPCLPRTSRPQCRDDFVESSGQMNSKKSAPPPSRLQVGPSAPEPHTRPWTESQPILNDGSTNHCPKHEPAVALPGMSSFSSALSDLLAAKGRSGANDNPNRRNDAKFGSDGGEDSTSAVNRDLKIMTLADDNGSSHTPATSKLTHSTKSRARGPKRKPPSHT